MKEKNRRHIMVGIGEILWDMLPMGKQLGGAPANFAYHVSQLGNSGVVVSSIGEDAAGDEILQALKEKNIKHLITHCHDYPTGSVTVRMSEGGSPSYIIHEDAAWDYLAINAEHIALAKKADVVCYGTLSQRSARSAEAIRTFILHTRESCLRILDINLRQHYYSQETIVPLLDLSNILKLNDEELLEVAAILNLSGTETELLAQLQQKFALNLIILTRGARGSRLFAGTSRQSEFKGYPVEIVDTVGAGDSFTAAVATGLCRGMSLEAIHPFAAGVAAFVCEHSGATPEYPPLTELCGGV